MPLKRGQSRKQPRIPLKEMTPEKWKLFLEHIAHGAQRHEAIQAADLTNKSLQLFLHLDPDAVDQYRTAKAAFLRKDWDFGLIEQILNKIASGMRVKEACEAHDMDFRSFVWVMLNDPAMKGMYDDARQIAIEIMADETLAIADDSSRDRDVDGKADHELVNRDRLRVSQRNWIMSRLFHARYGDKIQKNISKEVTINHVDALENARKRKEAAHVRRQEILEKQREDEGLTVH